MWVAMLVLAGVLIGGCISFIRHRQWLPVMVLAAGAVLCLAAALSWAPRP